MRFRVDEEGEREKQRQVVTEPKRLKETDLERVRK